jgi:outer membrane murein-binding lipoprotein Lpp
MQKKQIILVVVAFLILGILGWYVTRNLFGGITTGLAGLFTWGSVGVAEDKRRAERELSRSQELNSRISERVSDVEESVSDIRATSERLEKLDERADKFAESSGDTLRRFDELLRKGGYPENDIGD